MTLSSGISVGKPGSAELSSQDSETDARWNRRRCCASTAALSSSWVRVGTRTRIARVGGWLPVACFPHEKDVADMRGQVS
eukprot:CAMPEP_0177750186 /NCGR_PEP_ID=MMETSP0484_2-20121128/32888_1 /TAXON_ID=354590 /ORGANISM="Rhodomonas lens, Strain RHODO" /LENGTH=79 /DNA_ID=CAMNT_0019265225 /DNA_START=1161 /DNA_END=1397 /DNA_ORIENTATION=-